MTMTDYEKYSNDPEIVAEPAPLRKVHAMRLKIYDETKDLIHLSGCALHETAPLLFLQDGLCEWLPAGACGAREPYTVR